MFSVANPDNYFSGKESTILQVIVGKDYVWHLKNTPQFRQWQQPIFLTGAHIGVCRVQPLPHTFLLGGSTLGRTGQNKAFVKCMTTVKCEDTS